MNIPDKAVEAAARDLYETEPLALVNEATETMAAKPWEWLSEDFRAHKMQQARATLEAAAPFIAAQALRDAAEDLAQKLHEPGCNWGTRANDAGHLLALADLQESTQ